jgi:hypothetical protein
MSTGSELFSLGLSPAELPKGVAGNVSKFGNGVLVGFVFEKPEKPEKLGVLVLPVDVEEAGVEGVVSTGLVPRGLVPTADEVDEPGAEVVVETPGFGSVVRDGKAEENGFDPGAVAAWVVSK